MFFRNGIAGMLGLSERQVRVIAPFVGGGFGPKIMLFYPEEVVIPWAAMKLNRPVKWIEDRLEHFFATTQERGQTHDAEIALAADGRILGVKDVFLHDTGAYNPYGLTVPINSQCTLLGPYVIPNYDSTFTAIFTNKPIVTPYRGAGRQHGVFVIERLLDIAAHELNIDRAEIRRRNLIPPDAFPYNNEIIYQDFTQLSYDSGNYEPILDKALEMIGLQALPRRGAAAACARRAATSASASPVTSKAPASDPMKAPRSRCRPTARSAWRPASARKGRDTSPCSPRSSPISSASKWPTSTS